MQFPTPHLSRYFCLFTVVNYWQQTGLSVIHNRLKALWIFSSIFVSERCQIRFSLEEGGGREGGFLCHWRLGDHVWKHQLNLLPLCKENTKQIWMPPQLIPWMFPSVRHVANPGQSEGQAFTATGDWGCISATHSWKSYPFTMLPNCYLGVIVYYGLICHRLIIVLLIREVCAFLLTKADYKGPKSGPVQKRSTQAYMRIPTVLPCLKWCILLKCSARQVTIKELVKMYSLTVTAVRLLTSSRCMHIVAGDWIYT